MKRTRLSPEARCEQLLDVATQLIVSHGLQRFSLKQLAVDAGVSEPLLFHYFSSRLDLLQQLLSRDYDRYLQAVQTSLDGTESLGDVLRFYVSRNYDHHAEDNVIDILLADPEISIVVEERRRAHQRLREKSLIRAIAYEFGVKRKKAAMLAMMASSASFAAACYAHDNRIGRAEAIETALRFMTGGFESIGRGEKRSGPAPRALPEGPPR